MKPDTFSQYGYADATNLRALRRGYGHDIYPQFPTAYDTPRLVAGVGNYNLSGLGSVTRKGFTVEYYADPATLKFKDRKMKKLYEDLRNADVDFQKSMNDVSKSLKDVLGTLEFVSGGKIKAADLKKLLRVKLPTSGVAVFLEVACGGRPMDKGFQAVGKMLKQDLEGATALFGTLGGVAAAISAAAVPLPALVPAAAVLVPVAAIALPAAGLCAVVAALLGSAITGKLPSKKDFGDGLKAAARLSGSPEPSQAEIDAAYKGLKDANDAAKVVKQAATPAKEQKGKAQTTTAPPAALEKTDTFVREQPPVRQVATSGNFPIVPVVAVVGLLGALVLLKKRK
jgi:hypothetical protein